MTAFMNFEREVVRILIGPHVDAAQVTTILVVEGIVSYQHTGVGYFLTVRSRALPSGRIVCNTPLVMGTCGDVQCGFIVFLENGELTLECHSFGDAEIPDDIRDRQVKIESGV